MFRPVRRRATLTVIGAFALWWGSTFIFPPAVLIEIISTLILLVCVIGLWRWGPTGWRVFWQGAKRPEDWGILAIDFVFISIAALRIYTMAFRALDRPAWLQDSYWATFFVYLMLCALTLFVAATKEPRE